MMITSEEALLDLNILTKNKDLMPENPIYANIESQSVNLNDLAINSPYLFYLFTGLFCRVATPDIIKTWRDFKQAYIELSDADILPIKNIREDLMQEQINIFAAKIEGPFLVPLKELEKTVIQVDNDGKSAIQVIFNDYIILLGRHYGINYNDFFNHYTAKEAYNLSINKIWGISKEEYNSKIKSEDEYLMDAKRTLIQTINEDINGMPFVDYWDYLLNNDFKEISEDGLVTMFNNYQNINYVLQDDILVHKELFINMKKSIFKEISQHPYYDGKVVFVLENRKLVPVVSECNTISEFDNNSAVEEATNNRMASVKAETGF